jgi:hypothetical protein
LEERIMWFFRYTAFLENQNKILNEKVEALENRNHALVLEILSKVSISALSAPEKPEPKHKMEHLNNRANCSCGWTYVSEDPGQLQTAIVAHYREIPANRGRKTWAQARVALETAAEAETKEMK